MAEDSTTKHILKVWLECLQTIIKKKTQKNNVQDKTHHITLICIIFLLLYIPDREK